MKSVIINVSKYLSLLLVVISLSQLGCSRNKTKTHQNLKKNNG